MQQVFHPIKKKKIYLLSIKIMFEGKRAQLCFLHALQTEFDALGFVFAWCGLTLKKEREVLVLGGSIHVSLSSHSQTGSHTGAGGVCWDFFR